MRPQVLLATCTVVGLLGLPVLMLAQQQRETVAPAMTERQRRQQEERLRKELESPYKKWLDEEVRWIITDEERKAFSRFETDEERQDFIEQFWLRRDPTPDTEENELREEHYRRIAWANDRFASGIPGWKTDRGMIYIKFGAPDEREEHPTGGTYNRPIEEGGGQTTVFPFEKWRYRYIENVGQDVIIEFVDKSMTNEYRMTWDPTEKDALLRVPGAGLTLYEQLGLADKIDRFQNTYGMPLGQGPLSNTAQMNVFDRMQRYVAVQKAPAIKFTDLEAAVNSTIRYDLLPMRVRAHFIPVTEASVLVSITIQFDQADLQFRQKDTMAEAVVDLHASITTMTRRPVTRFEDIVSVKTAAEYVGQVMNKQAVYHKMVSLLPGRYRLSIGAKDEVGGNLSTYEMALDVPRFQEDRLQASSLILADVLEKIPTRSIGTGPFVIGSTKVRPRVNETFKKDETMGIFLQVYNFEPNETTRKAEGSVTYEIVKNGSTDAVFAFTEDVSALSGGASQMTIEKRLPLDKLGLTPGDYTLQIKVTDSLRNETLAPSAKFTIN